MKTNFFNSVSLAAAMIVAFHASAYDFMVDGIAYNKNSDGTSVSVTSTGTEPNYKDLEHINIPAQVTYGGKTYKVTAIGYYGLCGAIDVKSVTLPEGLLSIGQCGMNALASITELTLPSSLESVRGWAFENLEKVESIVCLATQAPRIDGGWFHNYDRLPTCPFYVPQGSLESYQSSSYWNAFNLQEMEERQDTLTTHIGTGEKKNEILPIFNWWLDSYTGNECIYIKEDLGMRKGDKIVALSYNCVQNSASGGNFNVRIKNTDISAFRTNTDLEDVSVMEVSYDDKVYGNVTMGSYSAGDWITFPLDEPFVYEGENIIVDIRNTAPSNYRGWVYFASTEYNERRAIAWRNGKSEDVYNSGFNHVDGATHADDYGIYAGTSDGKSETADVIITYLPSSDDASIRLNRTFTSLVVGDSEQIIATVTPNKLNTKVSWSSNNTSVATVDQNGVITAVAVGNAKITATVNDNPELTATCKVIVVSPEILGDVDGNGIVNGSDVTSLYCHLLDGTNVIGNPDVNDDGIVNGADITALYSLILGQ